MMPPNYATAVTRFQSQWVRDAELRYQQTFERLATTFYEEYGLELAAQLLNATPAQFTREMKLGGYRLLQWAVGPGERLMVKHYDGSHRAVFYNDESAIRAYHEDVGYVPAGNAQEEALRERGEYRPIAPEYRPNRKRQRKWSTNPEWRL